MPLSVKIWLIILVNCLLTCNCNNSTYCIINDWLLSLVDNYATNNRVAVPLQHNHSDEAWFKLLNDSCHNLTNLEKDGNNLNQDVAWEFSSALFLCMTILTTIGNHN